jgi:hypothetical protein
MEAAALPSDLYCRVRSGDPGVERRPELGSIFVSATGRKSVHIAN